jgi:hypothetical protein
MRINLIVLAFLVIALILPNISYASGRSKFSNSPRLPEPMVFDLVLPLGAKRNEYEFNTLFQYDFEENATLLNPEFEYAFADGYGIEFEFPMKNTELEAYKIALQGTFSFLNTRKFIHGWQYIAEYFKHSKELESDFLYIFGYQFNEKWSTLNMTGFRFTDFRSRGHIEGLLNSNIFYTFTEKLILGLEVNWESRPNRPDKALVMPQLHIQVAEHAKIQVGFGMKRADHENFPHAASRIIFGF